ARRRGPRRSQARVQRAARRTRRRPAARPTARRAARRPARPGGEAPRRRSRRPRPPRPRYRAGPPAGGRRGRAPRRRSAARRAPAGARPLPSFVWTRAAHWPGILPPGRPAALALAPWRPGALAPSRLALTLRGSRTPRFELASRAARGLFLARGLPLRAQSQPKRQKKLASGGAAGSGREARRARERKA